MILRWPLALMAAWLLTACVATPPLLPPTDPAFAAEGIRSIAVAPVAYATFQPGEMCSAFIDEELRSALIIGLREHGYEAFAVGNSVPRSFSAGAPVPLPGDPPPAGPFPAPGVQGVLHVWIEEYFENTLCGWEGPKYLTIGTVGALYAGSPPREIWRGRARVAEQGYKTAREMIWLATTQSAARLLADLPGAPGSTEGR